jgi:hypothetical protein
MEKLKIFTEEEFSRIILLNIAYNKLVNSESSTVALGIQYDICDINQEYQ